MEISQQNTQNQKQLHLKNRSCKHVRKKNAITVVIAITIKLQLQSQSNCDCNHNKKNAITIKFRTLLLKIEKDTLTLNISGKEFHVIIPLWRTQCFVLDLFTPKILIWLLVLVLLLWIWLLINKLDFTSEIKLIKKLKLIDIWSCELS